MNLAIGSFALALGTLMGSQVLAQHPTGGEHAHRIITPEDLKWVDVPSLPPGAKVAVIEGNMGQEGTITARVKLPANFKIPPHYHETIERVVVISGTVNIGMSDTFDEKKTTAMKPGTVLLMPARMHHFAWTGEETIFQLNVNGPWSVTYLNPADDPRKK
jgi:mannose-6-phosphate isomerase-like protein (cupin superfamily)